MKTRLDRFGVFPLERNAPWPMFSAESEKVKFGAANYRWKRPASGIINKLFKKYKTEAVTIIPYTFEDYQRKVKEEVLKSLTQEEIAQLRKRLRPEEVLTVSMKSNSVKLGPLQKWQMIVRVFTKPTNHAGRFP